MYEDVFFARTLRAMLPIKLTISTCRRSGFAFRALCQHWRLYHPCPPNLGVHWPFLVSLYVRFSWFIWLYRHRRCYPYSRGSLSGYDSTVERI